MIAPSNGLLIASTSVIVLCFAVWAYSKYRTSTHPLNRWDERFYRRHTDFVLQDYIAAMQDKIAATGLYPHLSRTDLPGLQVSSESQSFFTLKDVHPTVNGCRYRYGYALPLNGKHVRIVIFRADRGAPKACHDVVYIYGRPINKTDVHSAVQACYKLLLKNAENATHGKTVLPV